MDAEEKKPKFKKPGYMKWYPEKWLSGSLREEFTSAERGVWGDFLCLGYENDPPGQIDFTSFRRLANRLSISKKLLMMTLRRAVQNAKIRIIRICVDPENGKKFEDFEITLDQLGSIGGTFDTKSSKVGVPLYAIIFLRWDDHQPAWLRQRPYRKKGAEAAQNKAKVDPGSDTEKQIKGEERTIKGEEIKLEDSPNPNPPNPPNSPLPSTSNPRIIKGKTVKEEFIFLLQECRGYPFDEGKDSLLFDLMVQDCPGINILEQTQIKIRWWKDHDDALKADPRAQLKNFFGEEFKFKQRGGPQGIGDIVGIEDSDHRRFLGGLLKNDKKKKEPENPDEY
jgi:hypothetical protein